MISDSSQIFYWWLLLFFLGAINFPICQLFFSRFFDKGYVFGKIIGILLLSYLAWLFGSLKILPFFSEGLWLIILLLFGLNFFIKHHLSLNIKKIIKENWRVFLLEEIIFLAALTAWSIIRGFQPDINGLEKFMDYGFVNAILRSRYFPPLDMWLAGETINYYYFGHLTAAALTKLSGLDSAIAYNLMMATLFALTFSTAFSIGANILNLKNIGASLVKKKFLLIAGFLSAFFVTLGGNLQPFWHFLKNGSLKAYWYPDATRFIVQQYGAADNTIHEFPIYSFVVADLHGHLLNLPFVLLFIALIICPFTKKTRNYLWVVAAGLLLGVFCMTNFWDLPIYLMVAGLTMLYFDYLKTKSLSQAFSNTFISGFIMTASAFIFSLPFQITFKNIAQGIALSEFHSPLWMLFFLWGLPLISTIVLIAFTIINKKNIFKEFSPTVIIVILLAVGWFLVTVPEFIFVKDIYIRSHQRANTMFKLTYQSFVMFAFAAGYTITTLLMREKGILRSVAFSAILLISIPVVVYPKFAIRSYYGLKNYRGLDGINYLKNSLPNDYQAIIWLKKTVTDTPVIAEAVGESYTDFARISANTGLPTILGWRVHEWLWRGSFDEPGKRTEEVSSLYQGSLATVNQIISKYQVKLIVVGSLEKKQYPKLNEENFLKIGKVVFESGDLKIYKFEL